MHLPDLYGGRTFTTIEEGPGRVGSARGRTGVPLQIHGMDADPIVAGEGDLDAAREVVATVGPSAELFLPGDGHLFADRSLPGYDAAAAKLITERVVEFLDRL